MRCTRSVDMSTVARMMSHAPPRYHRLSSDGGVEIVVDAGHSALPVPPGRLWAGRAVAWSTQVQARGGRSLQITFICRECEKKLWVVSSGFRRFQGSLEGVRVVNFAKCLPFERSWRAEVVHASRSHRSNKLTAPCSLAVRVPYSFVQLWHR